MSKKQFSVNGVSGVGRASFPSLFEPNKDDKYAVTLIFDPDTEDGAKAIKQLKEIQDEVGSDFFEDWGQNGSYFEAVKYGDPDDPKTRPEKKGKWFVEFKTSAKSKFSAPKVVDPSGHSIITEEDAHLIYGGCYMRATFTCKAYNNKSSGVTFYLRNAMKVKDGERFSGESMDPLSEFSEFISEDVPAEDSPLFQ
jgi:hypothetical protein